MSGPVAFFDLDRTVLACNSATLWIRREARLGFIRPLDAARAAVWVGLYQLGFARIEAAIGDAIATLEGADEAALHQRTLEFWAEIAHQIRPGALDAIEAHRAQGHALWLLTSSSSYLAAPVVDALRLDGALATRFQVSGGRFTGRAEGALCYGAGKVEHAAALAERLGASLSDATFYTDSMSDLPMLEAVGRPVAVHPDPRLLRHARRAGWPVLDWGSAPRSRHPTGARTVDRSTG